jgi:hypothetical protein
MADKEDTSTEEEAIKVDSKGGIRIPSSLQTAEGNLSITKLLTKGLSPTTVTALVAAVASFYNDYRDMQHTVEAQQETIEQLQVDLEESDVHERLDNYITESTRLVRARFQQDERSMSQLRGAVGNLQTEVRVRHGVATFMPHTPPGASGDAEPVRLRRSEQIEAAAAQSDQAYVRAGNAMPDDDPLAGLEGL